MELLGEESTHMSVRGTKDAMGRVLLVCNDAAAVQQVTEGMQQFAVATQVCNKVSLALLLLNHQRFEAVVVDLELGQVNEVLTFQVARGPGTAWQIGR
jgi:hypothetical protein